MLPFTHSVSWAKLKSAVECDPSAATLSVVVLENQPPMSNTSPEGSGQQMWAALSCIKVTFVGENVPFGSKRVQERRLKTKCVLLKEEEKKKAVDILGPFLHNQYLPRLCSTALQAITGSEGPCYFWQIPHRAGLAGVGIE